MYDVYRTSHNHCNDLLTNRQSTVVESKFLRMRTIWRENSRRYILGRCVRVRVYTHACLTTSVLGETIFGSVHFAMFERRQAQRSRKHVVVKAGGKKSGARKKPAWDVRIRSCHTSSMFIKYERACEQQISNLSGLVIICSEAH